MWIWHTEHIHGHFRHRYAIHIWSDDFNLTTRNPWFSSFLVSSKSLSRYHGNHDRNHRVWNIASTERYIFHLSVHVLLECSYTSVLHNTSYCTKWSAVIVLLHLTHTFFFVYLDRFVKIVCCFFQIQKHLSWSIKYHGTPVLIQCVQIHLCILLH